MKQPNKTALGASNAVFGKKTPPLVGVACGMLGGVALFLLGCPTVAAVVAALLAGALFVWNSRRKSGLSLLIMLCVGLACGQLYAGAYDACLCKPARALNGETRIITCTVGDYATVYDNQQRVPVVIRGGQLGTAFSIHTLLYLPILEDTLIPGDVLTLTAQFYLPVGSDGFDAVSYDRANGYDILAKAPDADNPVRTGAALRPFSAYPKLLAHRIKAVLHRLFDARTGAFLRALLLGDKSKLDTLDYAHLRKAGLAHVTAVSGLHVGFLMALMLALFGKRLGSVLGLPVLACFWVMAGATPSVTRACILYAVMVVGYFAERKTDPFTTLAFALLVLLVWKPAALLSVSLQLSFASTLGILLFVRRIDLFHALAKRLPKQRHLRRALYAVCSVVCVSMSATLSTIPILLWHFGYLSILSPLSNVLALWAVSVAFPLALACSLIGLCSVPLASILVLPVKDLVAWIYFVAEQVSRLPVGVVYAYQTLDFVVIVLCCIICMVLLWKGSDKWSKIGLSSLSAGLIALCIWDSWSFSYCTTAAVFPEGSGQCIAVTHGAAAVLIDCGSSGKLRNAAQDAQEYLDWHGYTALDAVMITADDEAYTNNLNELLYCMPVKQLVVSTCYDNAHIRATARKTGTTWTACAPKDWTAICDEVSVCGAAQGEKLLVRVGGTGGALVCTALTPEELLAAPCSIACDTLVVSETYMNPDTQSACMAAALPERFVLQGMVQELPVCALPIMCPFQSGTCIIKISS